MLDKNAIIWFNGELKKFSDCSVSLSTHALHYSTSIFEGCRAYNNVIFKNREHSERLIKSGEIVDIKVPYSVEELMQASMDVLKANGLKDAYVRPFAWKGGETLGIKSTECKTNVAVMAWYWGNYYGNEKLKKGINLAKTDWVRPDPRSSAVQAKVSGNYYLGAANQNALKDTDYDDVLMLDWRGYVSECSSCNVFFIKDKKLFTPIADCFLSGITRQTIFEIAEKNGIECHEVRIKPEELGDFDEAFSTGTAVEVMPIGSIFDKYFYKPDFSLKIREMYLDLVS